MTTKFKVGDDVKVIDDRNCSYINYGDIFTVTGLHGSEVQVDNASGGHYYEANRFELAAPAAMKLKLPLAITRLNGKLAVLTNGSQGHEVTMVVADSGVTYAITEAEALDNLEMGIWTVNGAGDHAAVEDAKATLQAAKDAVTVAEAALATAEAAAEAHKPYLA